MAEEQELRRRRRRRTPAEIQQVVSEFKSGDLTQVEFCRRQDLVLSTLGRYLSRERAWSEASQSGLVAVELAVKKLGGEQGCGLSVMVGSGRRIGGDAQEETEKQHALQGAEGPGGIFGIENRNRLSPGGFFLDQRRGDNS